MSGCDRIVPGALRFLSYERGGAVEDDQADLDRAQARLVRGGVDTPGTIRLRPDITGLDRPRAEARPTKRGGDDVNHVQESSTRSLSRLQTTLGLRHLGVILPMLINYGHLLLSGCRPHWAPVALSLGAAALPLVILYERGDRRGAFWVAALFLPLNAWPIVYAATGGGA